MKTKLISIVAMLMLTLTFSYAENPSNGYAKSPTDLQQTINNQISFPESAIENLIEGAVFVEFTVKADGSIEVLNCFSEQGELQCYVFSTLSAMKVTPTPEVVGQTFTMRFDFKLV